MATSAFSAAATTRPPRAKRSRPALPDHPDAKLIGHCIEYAVHVSSGAMAYTIDPTDAEFASPYDSKVIRLADRALAAILECEAVTIDGVRAKARLVSIMLKDWGSHLDDLREQFLISLADDVVRLQRHARGLDRHLTPIVVPR